MKPLYILSGSLAVITADDLMRGSPLALAAGLMGGLVFLGAEALDRRRKKNLQDALRSMRELRDSLGER